MRVERGGSRGCPLLGGKQIGEFLALLAPALSVRRVRVFVENRLGEGAPADIADERGFFVFRRRTIVLGQRLDDADRRDIGGDLLLRCPAADGVFGRDAEIEARPLATTRSVRVYSLT